MGLFRKPSADPAELERLKAEIASMAARLDQAEASKSALDTKLDKLSGRLATPLAPPPAGPPPATVAPAELDMIRARIQRLAERIDEVPPTDDLLARVDALGQAPDRGDFDRVVARLDELDARPDHSADIEEIRRGIEAVAARVDAVDERVAAIATELANQITELGNELERIDGSPTDVAAVGAEVVDELRDAQTRLATEQARYQIAFRQDLADLAERLRRS